MYKINGKKSCWLIVLLAFIIKAHGSENMFRKWLVTLSGRYYTTRKCYRKKALCFSMYCSWGWVCLWESMCSKFFEVLAVCVQDFVNVYVCVRTNALPVQSLRTQSADCMLEHGTQPTGSPHRKRPLHCCWKPICPAPVLWDIQPLLWCCFRVSGACHISPSTHTRTKARRPFAPLHLATVFVWIGRGYFSELQYGSWLVP